MLSTSPLSTHSHPTVGTPAAHTDYIHFAGGSYSKTFAYYSHGSWKVVKQCKVFNHRDKDLRLKSEIDSIAGLPPMARKLFPCVLNRQLTDTLLKYELEYIPYDNFSEIVRSGAYSPEYLSSLLEKIYSTLFDVLYLPHKAINNTAKTLNYVDVIRERLHETVHELPKYHLLRIFIDAPTVLINGIEYPGLENTLKRAEQFLKDRPMPQTHNHGDLILQDILLNPETGDFRLIDSNGYSTSYMNDFAKTLLCLQTKYDLLYNGDYSLGTEIKNKRQPEARLTFTADDHFSTLDAMNANFQNYLVKNQIRFFENNTEWRETLQVLCGLQNIAIVMFHVLHHKKSKRACAFLLSGITTINEALNSKK